MSLTYVPLTELEAVNLMLAHSDYEPVDDLTAPIEREAEIAQQILHQTSRRVQLRGLECNTDWEVTKTPDGSSEITFSTDILAVIPKYRSTAASLRISSGVPKLYDMENNRFTWDGPVVVDTITFVPFADLPESVRSYIALEAAWSFASREKVSAETLQAVGVEHRWAKEEFLRYEIRSSRASFWSNPRFAFAAHYVNPRFE